MAACELRNAADSTASTALGINHNTTTSTASSSTTAARIMTRKRIAPEAAADFHTAHRFLRRTIALADAAAATNFLVSTPTNPPNYSTTMNVNNAAVVIPPVSTLTTLTSPPLGLFSSSNPVDNIAISSPPNNTTPAVCGFSGLPLFPPAPPTERTRGSAAMEDAWIDGIIKDLLHTSSNVSIPQLIHNVREIIYPCNPNLAVLLEYRLRCLLTKDLPPLPNSLNLISSESPSLTNFSLPPEASAGLINNQYLSGTNNASIPQINAVPAAATATPVNTAPQTLPPPPPQTQPRETSQPREPENSASPREPTPTSPPEQAVIATRDRREELRQQEREDEGGSGGSGAGKGGRQV